MINILKIEGASMQPEYNHNDYIIALKPVFNIMIKKNKNVIFMHSSLGLLIKKISNVDSQKKIIYVKGNNGLSISQEMLGPIKFSQIKGFPLIHIKNKSKT